MILNRRTHIQRSLVILVIITVMIIPDVLMELITELIHLILEVLAEVAHISFEWIESMLDHLIEHELHTELHETQTIVFYVIVTILAGPLYFNKARVRLYWHDLSFNDKIKLGLMTLSGLYIASFFFM